MSSLDSSLGIAQSCKALGRSEVSTREEAFGWERGKCVSSQNENDTQRITSTQTARTALANAVMCHPYSRKINHRLGLQRAGGSLAHSREYFGKCNYISKYCTCFPQKRNRIKFCEFVQGQPSQWTTLNDFVFLLYLLFSYGFFVKWYILFLYALLENFII